MPYSRKKRKTSSASSQTCKFCKRRFTNIRRHFAQNSDCMEYSKGDVSVLSKIPKKVVQSATFINQEMSSFNTDTYDLFHTQDMDASLFCVDVSPPDNSTLQKHNDNSDTAMNMTPIFNNQRQTNDSSFNPFSPIYANQTSFSSRGITLQQNKSKSEQLIYDDIIRNNDIVTDIEYNSLRRTYSDDNDSKAIDTYRSDHLSSSSSEDEEASNDVYSMINYNPKPQEIHDSNNHPTMHGRLTRSMKQLQLQQQQQCVNFPVNTRSHQHMLENNEPNSNSTHPSSSSSNSQSTKNHSFFHDTNQRLLFPPSTLCLYDFTVYQSMMIQNFIKLPIDENMIASVKLLKIMAEGRIAKCHYKSLIDWHETILKASMYNVSRSSSIIKSKDKVVKRLAKILLGEYYMKDLIPHPVHDIVQLPSLRSVKVSQIQLKYSLYSLLSDPEMLNTTNSLIHDPSYRKPSFHNTPQNLDVPRNNSTDDESKYIFEIHHGYSFVMAHQQFCHAENDVLVEIIPFIDGTGIDSYGRLNMEAIMFTLSIFRQSVRNQPKAWRLHGYIPNPCKENNGQDDIKDGSLKRKDQIQKREDYHHLLRYLLKDFYELEQSDGILWNVMKEDGSGIETVRFRFVIPFFIGDAVGNDKLCDRYISYSRSVKRLCRDCDCPSALLSKHDHICTLTKRSDIIELSDKQLQEISHYKVSNNALDLLSFGNDKHGSNGCLPPEDVHQFNQGTVKDQLNHFENCITQPGKDFLNTIVKYLAMNYHRQSARNYPDIQLFKDGLDKSQLTADEVMYKVFILYLTLVQGYVFKTLPLVEQKAAHRFKSKTKKKKPLISKKSNKDMNVDNFELHENDRETNVEEIVNNYTKTDHNETHPFSTHNTNNVLSEENNIGHGAISHDIDEVTNRAFETVTSEEHTTIYKLLFQKVGESEAHLKEWIKLLEFTLCLHSWLNQEKILRSDIDPPNKEWINAEIDFSKAEISMRHYMKLFTSVIKDPTGNGTDTAKTHWLLHIVHYIRKFGPPKVFSGQVPEHNLSPMVKAMARQTQQRPNILIEQATERYYEDQIISRVYNILELQNLVGKKKNNAKANVNSVEVNNLPASGISRVSLGRYIVHIDPHTKKYQKVVWKNSSHSQRTARSTNSSKKKLAHSATVLQQVIDRLRLEDFGLYSDHINCFTTLSVTDHSSSSSSSIKYRADPYFYKKPWLDWCVSDWGDTLVQDEESEFPCRIIMFLDSKDMHFEQDISQMGRYWAVVKSTKPDRRTNQEKRHIDGCHLIKSFEMELMLRIIPCESILRPTFVISDLNEVVPISANGPRKFRSTHCLQLLEIQKWPEIFITNNYQ